MNARPGYAPPNSEVEETVEVPAVGTVLVEEGEQYSVRSVRTEWHICTCTDGMHVGWPSGMYLMGYDTEQQADSARPRGLDCHVVPVHTYTVVGEVRA